ncbi:hypothetical protein Theba_2572 [Mesotoga prima MesG1.Ag.4.2]|uniref:Uncharacterized protein n=1 Tax=Mesotoga prima MesG1.Ag.4.2 TaxID=660470 RepID=I2F8B9_9BACT|nr:hypothetical protein Theba_2572 [Mesotoga prima MesG1.Ag.4.2]
MQFQVAVKKLNKTGLGSRKENRLINSRFYCNLESYPDIGLWKSLTLSSRTCLGIKVSILSKNEEPGRAASERRTDASWRKRRTVDEKRFFISVQGFCKGSRSQTSISLFLASWRVSASIASCVATSLPRTLFRASLPGMIFPALLPRASKPHFPM